MRYPAFLPEHGTIGFVAPSFGCATEPYRSAFDHALQRFGEMGYRTLLGPNCYRSDGCGISTSPEKCGKELNLSYASSDSDVLISCGGGELMCETVPYIDFSRIAGSRPKWYMGFSDNTNFTFLSATLSDTAAIYGPCASAFGMEPWHESVADAFDLLCGKRRSVHGYTHWQLESRKDENNPLAPYVPLEKTRFRRFDANGNKADRVRLRGRLLGGCMDCLSVLAGTEFDRVRAFNSRYRADGILWFLEACDLNVFSMRRVLWQMAHAGWFEAASGFLIGRPMHFGEEIMGLDQYEAVLEVLRPFRVPILLDLDIGHLPPMMPVITGALADCLCRGNRIEIRYPEL